MTRKQKICASIILLLVLICMINPVTHAIGARASAPPAQVPATYYSQVHNSAISKPGGETGTGDASPFTIPATLGEDPLVAIVVNPATKYNTQPYNNNSWCYFNGTSGVYIAGLQNNGAQRKIAHKIAGAPASLTSWLSTNFAGISQDTQGVTNYMVGSAQWSSALEDTSYTCSLTVYAVYQSLSPTPTPTSYCNDVVGTWRMSDLLSTGTITSGSLQASTALVDDEPSYVIDFTMTAPLPAYMMDGYNQAYLSIGVDMKGLQNPLAPATFIATVNGQTYTDPTNAGATIPVALGKYPNVDIAYHAVIPGYPSSTDTMEVVTVAVKIPTYRDSGVNLLCDGGMEQYPGSAYWELLNPGGADDFGRLNEVYQTSLENFMNGLAACDSGQQALGPYFKQYGLLYYTGRPIKQQFNWNGGIAEWKFRVAAGIGANAKVWIMDTAGTNVATLFQGPVSSIWSVKTGTVDLDEGLYWIVMDATSAVLQMVAYDDVAIGSDVDTDCQEDLLDIPTVPTPTPTNTGQPTATPSPTLQLTPFYTASPTTTGSATITTTVTTTARPTRTATIGATSSATYAPSVTVTRTPYGTPWNPTPNPNATGTPEGTPAATGTPLVGDYPPGNDEPGTGDCSRPANQWSLAWWLDYEVCRVLYAFSWQPVHSATMVAMPGIANTYEPFRSAYEIGEGIAAMQTEIATAVYGSTPYVNTGGPQTPIPDMFKAPANSPWNGAPLTIPDLDPKRTTTSQFSTYCNHRMLTVLGSVMTPGYCFVLNMLRDLGVLIWFQLLIDIFAVMSVIRQILSTIKFYPLVFNGGGKEAQ